jgi:site-specific recombinase XerD
MFAGSVHIRENRLPEMKGFRIMLAPITQSSQPSQIIHIQLDRERPRWLDFFDPDAAVRTVINHIETLPGSRHERHTMRAYLSSLADFCSFLGATVIRRGDEQYQFGWNGMEMPTRAGCGEYIAACKRKGLSSSTITRYMAAARHFVRALEEQAVYPQSGGDFVFILEAQRQLRLAASTKNPAADRTSNRPALEQYGTRLSLAQVNRVFESFAPEMQTITGRRDLALLYLGITSGLRAAELARLTLNSIQQGKDCYEVRVRGKRSNHDPVGIDSTAMGLIEGYVKAWNGRLTSPPSQENPHPPAPSPLRSEGESEGDARWIDGDTPIFQALLRGDHIPALGLRGYAPGRGLTPRAILQIVERRTGAALGSAITAHDMRRTCAYLMRSHGYEWDQIRAQLRHRSIGTTEKYVGQEQDLSRALLSKRVTFIVPSSAPSLL